MNSSRHGVGHHIRRSDLHLILEAVIAECSPLFIASQPVFATSAGSSFMA
jgi:hypothetical protein